MAGYRTSDPVVQAQNKARWLARTHGSAKHITLEQVMPRAAKGGPCDEVPMDLTLEGFRIRRMTVADLTFAASCTAEEGWGTASLVDFQGLVTHDAGGCLVAEVDGAPCGYLHWDALRACRLHRHAYCEAAAPGTRHRAGALWSARSTICGAAALPACFWTA